MFYIFSSENITFSKYAFYFINNSLYFITLYIIKKNTCIQLHAFGNTEGLPYSFTQNFRTDMHFSYLEFYGLVNTVKVMSNQSVNPLIFFLGRLSPLSSLPVLLSVIDKCSS